MFNFNRKNYIENWTICRNKEAAPIFKLYLFQEKRRYELKIEKFISININVD